MRPKHILDIYVGVGMLVCMGLNIIPDLLNGAEFIPNHFPFPLKKAFGVFKGEINDP